MPRKGSRPAHHPTPTPSSPPRLPLPPITHKNDCLPDDSRYFPTLMSRRAGKAKTRKAVAKRFKVTGSGKILRRKKGARHLMRRKNAKRKRSLGQDTLVSDADLPMIRRNLPFG
jgi:large subunit ribosomal protein L35